MLRKIIVPALLLATACWVGCGAASNSPAHRDAGHGEPGHAERSHQEGHAHAAEGPHGGSIIELGTEEYHAELAHDEQTGQVAVYFLDSSAKLATPIDAPEVKINLRHDGRAEQFTLTAVPAEGDAQGTSSRFVSTDKQLAQDLDQAAAHGQLVAMIGGKQYRGDIEHDHNHGDDHSHDDHSHDEQK